MVDYLSKYERAILIGMRLMQLEGGAFPVNDIDIRRMNINNVSNIEDDSKCNISTLMIDIAERDIDSGNLPFIISRILPNGNRCDMKLGSNNQCEKCI